MTPTPRSRRGHVRRATASACGAHVRLHLVTEDADCDLLVPAQLTYTRADPYAVRLHCHTGRRTTITWVLARETLRNGLLRPTGRGDVHVRPGDGLDAGYLLVTLGSGPEAALLRADADEVERFLALTDMIVRPGCEHRHLDLDTLIAQLSCPA